MPVCQKIEYYIQRISLNFLRFTCNWKQELCTTKTFRNWFFITVIGNAKLRSSFVEWPNTANHAVAQGIQFCTLTYFLCKIIICNNYFIVKFIKMYSLIFTWIVWSIQKKWKLRILIENKFEHKIYFKNSPLKMECIFLRRKMQFFRLNLDRDCRNHFLYFL